MDKIDKNIEQQVQKAVWKHSLTEEDKEKFASYMKDLNKFCKENGIKNTRPTNFVFKLNDVNYMITNDKDIFNFIKDRLHVADVSTEGLKIDKIFYASKFRVMDIYKDIQAGKNLDFKGRELVNKQETKEKQEIQLQI